MLPPNNSGGSDGSQQATPRVRRAKEDFLLDKSKDDDSGTYRRNLEREIDRFITWYHEETGDTLSFDDIDTVLLRQYARHLCRQGWTDGTTLTYYANFSAFIGWAHRDGYLDEHYAEGDATEPLPEDDGRRSGDQQAWSSTQRAEVLAHVDDVASGALDDLEDGGGHWEVVKAFRDRALVAVLCYTGIRAGEFLNHTDDKRRNGIRWEDVNLDDGHVVVLSKRQKWDDRSLLDQTIHPLRMLKNSMNPADDWPVFPTLAPQKVFPPVREALAETDRDPEIVSKDSVWELYRELELTPPPLSTSGARRILKRITENAEIEVEQGEYLTPHGGRRGTGEVMVRGHGFAAAARLLDDSEKMVRERYSHIDAGEMADVASDVFAEVDSEGDGEIPDSYR